jgi:two-component system response regulator
MMKELRNILIVEDNIDDAELTKLALKSINFVDEIIWISDSEKALEYIDSLNLSGQMLPAFILLDLKMPKLNGFDVLQKIREKPRTSLIPVIIFTSSNELSDMRKAYQYGANSFIQKPVIAEDFENIIQKTGLYWANINQLPE